MADFLTAVGITLTHEGGYEANPNDPGGATNMGIEQSEYSGDIKDLTREQAIEIYQKDYWNPLYSQITSQPVANKLFDLGVLFGINTVVRILQNVLEVTPDSVFGPQTLEVLNQCGDSILATFKEAVAARARQVVAKNSNTQEFLAGWLNRIYS